MRRRRSSKLLRLTRSLGLATQTPYFLDRSGEIFPTPYLVIEYIEGQPEFAPVDLPDFTLQLATQLARIHSVDRSKLNLPFLSRPAKGFAEAVGELSSRIDASFDVERIRDNWKQLGQSRSETHRRCSTAIIGPAIFCGAMLGW